MPNAKTAHANGFWQDDEEDELESKSNSNCYEQESEDDDLNGVAKHRRKVRLHLIRLRKVENEMDSLIKAKHHIQALSLWSMIWDLLGVSSKTLP